MLTALKQRKPASVRKVIAACGGFVRDKRIRVLGMTFKLNTDDLRDAPSISIIQLLVDAGSMVRAYDPEGMEMAISIIGNIDYADSAYGAAEGVDCLVLVTEWNAFRSLDLVCLKSMRTTPVMVDLRNVYRRAELEAAGFEYFSIDRPASAPGSQTSIDVTQ